MRGIMTFDDYNYSIYNEYVLLEEPGQEEKSAIIKDRLKLQGGDTPLEKV